MKKILNLKLGDKAAGYNIYNLFFLITLSVLLVFAAGCEEKKKKVILPSEITIRSVPDKVNISLISHKNRKIGVTAWKGTFSPGMYVFEFSKPGYKTTWRKIICKSGSREDLEVKMDPVTASVIIETEPAGVAVSLGDRQIGETPLAIHHIPMGTHNYILKKPTFSEKEVSVVIEDERPKLIFENMNSNIGTILVKSTPSSANLFINDTSRGKTPSTIILERGDYDIRIELPGYSIHREKVSVGRGKTVTVNAALQELPGSIKIVTDPEIATLHINGKQYNNTPTTLENLKPGSYEIKVSHENYDTSTRKVSLAAGQNLIVKMKLDTNMGGIDLIIHPPGITVYVDGKKIGVTEEGETKDLSKIFEIRGLKSGIHQIMVAHKRAVPSRQKSKIEVKKGEISRPPEVRLWVKDTYLKLKDGTIIIGRIAQDNDDWILFEHDPTMKMKHNRDEIEILRPLKAEE